MIESIIAISVAVVALLSSLTLLSRSLALNRQVSDRNTATFLAVEGVEIVKNLIDAQTLGGGGWPSITNGDYTADYSSYGANPLSALRPRNAGSECLAYDGKVFTSSPCGGNPPPKYHRWMSITSFGASRIAVSSTVQWTDQTGTETVVVADQFLNWRP